MMRRAANLFDKICEPENLRVAFHHAARGKRGKAVVRRFSEHLDSEISRISLQLQCGQFVFGRFEQFLIRDPKERVITAPCFQERVVHHAIMNVCEPIFDRWLIDDTFACRRGKGRDSALRRAQRFAARSSFCLHLDIRKYFDSIDHERLICLLEKRFKDQRLLELLRDILGSFRAELGIGVPIGSLTSQHFANFYLGWFDRFVKEQLRLQGYVRYMDDMLFWHDDQVALKAIELGCREFVSRELKLEMKPSQTAPMIQDLGAGECPQCHTLNESTRKFCRGCAASLLVPCLQCSQQMPIWDNVCGECGGRQEQLLEQRNAQHAVQREEATRLHADYRFTDAIKLLEPLRSIEDQRFSDVSQWARTYSTDLQEESERLLRETKERFAEARKHRKAFDYPAAIASMQQIRSLFLTSQMSDYLKQLQADQRESDELLEKIRDAIKSNDVDDLLPRVERALKLRGDRNDLQKLQAQLVRRNSKQKHLAKSAFLKAKKLLDKQEYEQAISVLSEVPPKHVDHEVRQLETLAELKLDSLRALDDEITSKQSDEDADFDQLTELLRSYLKLKSDDRLKQQLLDKLVAERNALIKHDELLLAEARAKYAAQQYTQALHKLNGITLLALENQVESLRTRIRGDWGRTQELDAQINEAISQRRFNNLQVLLDQYLALQVDDTERLQLRTDLKVLEEANACFLSQNYYGTVARLKRVKSQPLLQYSSEIRKQATDAEAEAKRLYAQIQLILKQLDGLVRSGANHRVNKQYAVLWDLVHSYLKLKHNNGEILSLRTQLAERAQSKEKASEAKKRQEDTLVLILAGIVLILIVCLAGQVWG
jgi:RNA-directed DNA polymerase